MVTITMVTHMFPFDCYLYYLLCNIATLTITSLISLCIGDHVIDVYTLLHAINIAHCLSTTVYQSVGRRAL